MRILTPAGAASSTQWYETAGLGMFIHWGLSSVRAIGDLSWCMIKDTPYDKELRNTNKLTPEEYWKQADPTVDRRALLAHVKDHPDCTFAMAEAGETVRIK